MSFRRPPRHLLPAALVLFVALVVRVWVLVEGSDAPTFLVPVVDARTYDLAARGLAGGLGLDYRFFWQPFFYPVFLGVTYALSGGSILVAKVVQLVLGVATCWLTLRVGRRLAGETAGLIAGLICAVYGPLIFFETELLATGWACFWAILLLDRLSLAHPDGARRGWLFTGLIAALAVLTRPTFLPAIALASAFVLWRSPVRAWLPRAALLALGFAVFVTPVAIMGMEVAGYASFLPASGPMNLFLGNHREPCETLTIRPGEAWQELTRQARPAKAGDLRANRDHFGALLVDEVGQHPGAVLSGLLRKSVQVFSSRELPRNVDPYFQREYSPLLAVLMFRVGGFGFPMGVLLPFAVWGAWVGRRRLPGAFLVFVAVYLLGVVAVFVSARYRMPMVPALAILASVGIVAVVDAIRARRARVLVAAGFTMLAVLAAAVLPGPFCEEQVDYRAETLYAVGYARHSAGELDAAAQAYEQALRSRPDYAELLNQYALLRSQQDRWSEAIALWTRAVRVDPGNFAVRMNLARACAMQERHGDALAHYEAALAIEPSDADALLGSGFALLGVGRFDQGVERLERALDLRPEYGARLPAVIDALTAQGRADLAARLRSRIRP